MQELQAPPIGPRHQPSLGDSIDLEVPDLYHSTLAMPTEYLMQWDYPRLKVSPGVVTFRACLQPYLEKKNRISRQVLPV
jgi:hypothetical protein